jgi:hypothetical protein
LHNQAPLLVESFVSPSIVLSLKSAMASTSRDTPGANKVNSFVTARSSATTDHDQEANTPAARLGQPTVPGENQVAAAANRRPGSSTDRELSGVIRQRVSSLTKMASEMLDPRV